MQMKGGGCVQTGLPKSIGNTKQWMVIACGKDPTVDCSVNITNIKIYYAMKLGHSLLFGKKIAGVLSTVALHCCTDSNEQ